MFLTGTWAIWSRLPNSTRSWLWTWSGWRSICSIHTIPIHCGASPGLIEFSILLSHLNKIHPGRSNLEQPTFPLHRHCFHTSEKSTHNTLSHTCQSLGWWCLPVWWNRWHSQKSHFHMSPLHKHFCFWVVCWVFFLLWRKEEKKREEKKSPWQSIKIVPQVWFARQERKAVPLYPGKGQVTAAFWPAWVVVQSSFAIPSFTGTHVNSEKEEM